MNSKQRGVYNECKAVVKLEKEGWVSTRTKNGSRFCKEKDYFNLFDIISVKNGEVLFTQVKSSKGHVTPELRKDILFWSYLYKQHCRIMAWVKEDRKWFEVDYNPLLQESLAPGL